MEKERNYAAEKFYSDGESNRRTGLVFSIINFSLYSFAYLIAVLVSAFAIRAFEYELRYVASAGYDFVIIILLICFIVMLLVWGMMLAALILIVKGKRRIENGDMSGTTMLYVAAGLSFPTGLFGIISGIFLIMAGVSHKKSKTEYEFSRNNHGYYNQDVNYNQGFNANRSHHQDNNANGERDYNRNRDNRGGQNYNPADDNDKEGF